MLVLTRKQDEGIVIGNNIVIKVLGMEDGKVKLGIQAPAEIEIHRQEVFEQIKQENRNATHVKDDAISQLKKK